MTQPGPPRIAVDGGRPLPITPSTPPSQRSTSIGLESRAWVSHEPQLSESPDADPHVRWCGREVGEYILSYSLSRLTRSQRNLGVRRNAVQLGERAEWQCHQSTLVFPIAAGNARSWRGACGAGCDRAARASHNGEIRKPTEGTKTNEKVQISHPRSQSPSVGFRSIRWFRFPIVMACPSGSHTTVRDAARRFGHARRRVRFSSFIPQGRAERARVVIHAHCGVCSHDALTAIPTLAEPALLRSASSWGMTT